MKVLVVCNGKNGKPSAFVAEQVEALKRLGVEMDYFIKKDKGIFGYLKNYFPLKKTIKNFKPDLIHAHYSFSGLLANMQRKIPVVTTYHGSDIHQPSNLKYSKLTYKLSRANIFVSEKLKKTLGVNNGEVIPCGVDFDIFFEISKEKAKKSMKLDTSKNYILFSSSFNVPIKNSTLAKEVVKNLNNPNIELIELDNYTREEVNLLFNASDLALMTSLEEGSPQFIKEAMATNTPIVSTNVGDVEEITKNIDGVYISNDWNVSNITLLLNRAIDFASNKVKTNGREVVNQIDNKIIASKIYLMYQKTLKKSKI